MKKPRSNKIKSPAKGATSALVISIAIHAGLFLLAGVLIVFTYKQTAPPVFDTPKPIERPKKQLQKLRVPVEKTKPKVSEVIKSTRSTAVPKFEIPEMSDGAGQLGDVLGGIEIELPDNIESVLGSTETSGNDLIGTYYDFKRAKYPPHRFAPLTGDEWRERFKEFYLNDWDPRVFSKAYRGPSKIYAKCLFLPPAISAMAPSAFGMPDHLTSGGLWIIHYKGQIGHTEGITFRFWVSVDDSLAIRINKKVVVAASFINRDGFDNRFEPTFGSNIWMPSDPDSGKYTYGLSRGIIGDWITLEPGELYDMEVVAGDNDFDTASFIVMVEEKGVEYEENVNGGPLLPIFRMGELSHDLLDKIYRLMPEGELSCTNGPIFKDY